MPDKKISELTEVASLASGDEFAVVDKSDTTQAGSGTTKRATRDTVRASVAYEAPLNPTWPEYGATWDGVTDDSAAIQAAINAAASPGGMVLLPPGTANLGTTSLTIPASNIELRGLGMLASTLKYGGSGAAIKNSDPDVLREYVGFYDFQVDFRTGTTGKIGMLLENFQRAHGKNVRLNGGSSVADNTGLKLSGSASRIVYLNRFENFHITATTCEWLLDNCAGNRFVGGVLDSSHASSTAIKAAPVTTGVGTSTWLSVAVQTAGGTVVQLGGAGANATDQHFVDCRFEPSASNFNVASGSGRCMILGGTYANVTFVDAAPLTNAWTIIVPSSALHQIGHGGASDNKKTVEIPWTGASTGITIGGDTNLYRPSADILQTDDEFAIKTAGKGLRVAEGSNARMGTATLVAGTVTVSTTAVATGDRIYLTAVNTGGTAGFLSYTISNGTSFTVTSSSGTDTRTFNWLIVRPA